MTTRTSVAGSGAAPRHAITMNDPNITNVKACVEDARQSGADTDAGPGDISDFALLRGKLETARVRLPPRYQKTFIQPFIDKLDEFGPVQFANILASDPKKERSARLMFDLAEAITQKGDGFLPTATD